MLGGAPATWALPSARISSARPEAPRRSRVSTAVTVTWWLRLELRISV